MNDTVVAILSAFFVIGIVVGIIAVIALSVLRAEGRGHQGDQAEPLDNSDQSPGSGWDAPDSGPDRRWPGDADNDFSGR